MPSNIKFEIDDKYYNKEYAKITAELETLNLKRDELLNSKLNDTKHKEKVEYIKETIGKGSEPLTVY
jgi:transcriptional antiterminator Rof (Rho-off)